MLLLLGVSLQPSGAWAAGDSAKGKDYYTLTCQTCHGPNAEGNRSMNSPRLVGLQEWYLVRQLNNFRSGVRGFDPEDTYGQQMAAKAKTLPNEQAVSDVVAYVSTLDAPPSPRTEVTGDPARGQELFLDCVPCHGTRAQGLDYGDGRHSRAPRLSGQDDWYLIRQLHNFAAGRRGTQKGDKEGHVMHFVAMIGDWSERDITDVVAYIKGIK